MARFRRRPVLVQNELEEFFGLPAQDFLSCNPVQWWYSNRHRFPNLYYMARDILSIPGMNSSFFILSTVLTLVLSLGSAVAVERIFSGGRNTISLRRASLKPDTIRALMLIKQRLRS